MRIALIGPTYPYRGGIAHYTSLLFPALQRRHEVLFVSFAAGYPRLLFPGRTDRDPSRRPIGGEAEFLLAPLRPLTWLRSARRVAAFEPDVVIVQWWVPFWAPSLIATLKLIVRRRPATRVVFDCHNVLPHDRPTPLERGLTRLALRLGDGFLVHSAQDEGLAREIVGLRPVQRSTLPVHAIDDASSNGGEPESCATLFDPALPIEADVILFFGFVRPYKGLECLVEALPSIVRRAPSAHLAVAGEFWIPSDTFRRQAEQLGVADRLHIADRYIPNEEVATIFARAKVCVLPYIHATQSGVVTLAFRYGVPLVVTDVGGLPEAVDDGITGRVVPPGDSAALAAAISGILADDDLRLRMRGAMKSGAGRFSWDAHLDVLETLFQEVADLGHSSGGA